MRSLVFVTALCYLYVHPCSLIRAITTLLGEGKAKPVIGQVFDINDAPKAHEEVISHSSGSKGKIVLRIASPGDASEL